MNPQTDDDSPNAFVRDARALLQIGRVDEARTLLDCVRTSSLDYPTFHVVEGECLLALGKVEAAREAFRHALHLLPNSARAAILLESTSNEPVHADKAMLHGVGQRTEVMMQSIGEPTLALLFEDESSEHVPEHPGQVDITRNNASPSVPKGFNLDRVANLLATERPLVRPTTLVSQEKESSSRASGEPEPLMSETLAQILLDQGKVEESLKAFKQLRTEFPTRAAYFDRRIKMIEEGLRK